MDISKSKKPIGDVPLEHIEQVTFVQWFESAYPEVMIFAIPNGGLRHPATARKLQLEGVKSGIPDLFIPAWKLWVEMKRSKGGKVSPEQYSMMIHLAGIGYDCLVGHGFEDAKKKVLEFAKSQL
jgi:hypothetical protein